MAARIQTAQSFSWGDEVIRHLLRDGRENCYGAHGSHPPSLIALEWNSLKLCGILEQVLYKSNASFQAARSPVSRSASQSRSALTENGPHEWRGLGRPEHSFLNWPRALDRAVLIS
jgi:hypothetical protein